MPANFLTGRHTLYYEAPGQSVAGAQERYDQAMTPLDVTVTPVPEPAAWCLLISGVAVLRLLPKQTGRDAS
jgi:hypothetical protein